MTGWLVAHAGALYVAAVVLGFAAVAAWETVAPCRPAGVPLAGRWSVNILLLFIGNLVVQAALPAAAIVAAVHAQAQGQGWLTRSGLPPWAQAVVGLVALDLLRWCLHCAMHRVPWLWRLHRVHHSDTECDCTVALRFHPLDALLTSAVTVAAVAALGVPPVAVLLADGLGVAFGFVAHANVRVAARLDRVLRCVFVTPDMHRVHHSTVPSESMSNLGVLFSCWDRLFGSHVAQPAAGHLRMTLGLDELRDPAQLTLARLLWLPLRAQAAGPRDAGPAGACAPPS